MLNFSMTKVICSTYLSLGVGVARGDAEMQHHRGAAVPHPSAGGKRGAPAAGCW